MSLKKVDRQDFTVSVTEEGKPRCTLKIIIRYITSGGHSSASDDDSSHCTDGI